MVARPSGEDHEMSVIEEGHHLDGINNNATLRGAELEKNARDSENVLNQISPQKGPAEKAVEKPSASKNATFENESSDDEYDKG
jgi:hypothetical protein